MKYKVKVSKVFEIEAKTPQEAVNKCKALFDIACQKRETENQTNNNLNERKACSPIKSRFLSKKRYESKDVMVSHPSHYQSKTGLEVIDVIKAFTDGMDGIEAYEVGNIIKYICRYKDKNGIQDIEKLIWYAHDLIANLKEKKK